MADISNFCGKDPEGKKMMAIMHASLNRLSGRIEIVKGITATFNNGQLHNENGPAWEEKGRLGWALGHSVVAVQLYDEKFSIHPPARHLLQRVTHFNFAALGLPNLGPAGWIPGEQPRFRLIKGGRR